MNTEENYEIKIQRNYSVNSQSILKFFEDKTVFKLTGADDMDVDFRTGKKFQLNFNNRGKISGEFISISKDRIIMDWNVEGFGRAIETHTVVEVILNDENGKCNLTLSHKNIPVKESADAKNRAWTEIFEEIQQLI